MPAPCSPVGSLRGRASAVFPADHSRSTGGISTERKSQASLSGLLESMPEHETDEPRPTPQTGGGKRTDGAPDGAPGPRPGTARRVGKGIAVTVVTLLILLSWVLVIGVGAAVGYAWWASGYVTDNLRTIEVRPETRIADTPGTVWLLTGTDGRDPDQADLEGVFGARTDTIMLLHIAEDGYPTLLSVPRDLLVDIPGYGPNKINAAFAWGDADLLVETIEQNTGLHIDHYAEIGMRGIVDLTDAVDGVRVCIDFDVDESLSGLTMTAGCHDVDGTTALQFVRMRYADPRGDIGRIERQQQFIGALMAEILQPENLRPQEATEIIDAVTENLLVDDRADIRDLGEVGLALARLATDRGEIAQLPIATIAGWYNGQSVVLADPAEAAALFVSLGARQGALLPG